MSLQSLWYQRIPLSHYANPAILTESVRQRARIGRVHWETSFSAIPDSLDYKEPILNYCRGFEFWEAQGLGLILHGKFGTGKTTIGSLVLKYCIAKGGRALSYRYIDLMDQLTNYRAHFAPNGAPLDVALIGVNCLMIDDLEIETGDRLRKLESVLRRRYDDNLPTVITTNRTKEDLFEILWLKDIINNSYLAYDIEGINWRKDPPPISHNGNLL